MLLGGGQEAAERAVHQIGRQGLPFPLESVVAPHLELYFHVGIAVIGDLHIARPGMVIHLHHTDLLQFFEMMLHRGRGKIQPVRQILGRQRHL